MKTSGKLILFSAFSFLLSCGTNVQQAPKQADNRETYITRAREILLNAEFVGTGKAKSSSLSQSRTLALARARTDLAMQISEYLKQNANLLGPEAMQKRNTEENRKKVVDIVLKNTRTTKIEVLDDGTVIAQVILIRS